MDARPLVDQLAKLQAHRIAIQEDLEKAKLAMPDLEEPISLECLSIFRKQLKALIQKAENDPAIQAQIAKKVVHKITIQKEGFEIHFRIGKTYYLRELGKFPSSRFFAFEPTSFERKEPRETKSAAFARSRSSTLLTNGDLTRS